MSGQQSSSSKRIQGIAASLPLATRKTATQSEPVETERTAPKTDPGENLGKIAAENSAKQKCKFTSQAGKSHPRRDQEAASSADATRPETGAVQRNDGKRSGYQGRDSGFADKSQADCTTWESPTTKTTQAAPRKTDTRGRRPFESRIQTILDLGHVRPRSTRGSSVSDPNERRGRRSLRRRRSILSSAEHRIPDSNRRRG